MIESKKALKIKAKHLGEEARIIRFEEKRTTQPTRNWLNVHRKQIVRPEARATHIAYAFAKGTPLQKVERYPDKIPMYIWERASKMAHKYSGKSKEEFINWLSSAVQGD